jgi:hypothetical protein
MQRVQGSSEDGRGGAGEATPQLAPRRGGGARVLQIVPWVLAAVCFAFLYRRLSGAAAREGLGTGSYLLRIFADVPWPRWLALMLPYSCLFLLVDSAVTWRVISWFNAPVRYLDIVPIRASAYILSILNEQVGKGAIALYLNRRDGIPGWEVGSSMLFIMFCELYYLLSWATLGYALRGDSLPPQFGVIPWVAVGALGFFAAFYTFFRGHLPIGTALRERPIFRAFRQARIGHYLGIIALRSPAMIGAIVVYTLALRLFGIDEQFGTMLSYLPLIFFGAAVPGPMRSVAIVFWVALYPDNAGAMTAFGFVQHNFFIFFNAAIGLLFLRRANRQLFGTA